MLVTPLPLPPPLDLTNPSSLTDWETEATLPTGGNRATWLSTSPPLTLPQLLGLVLGRVPERVSTKTLISTATRMMTEIGRLGPKAQWTFVRLRGLTGLWNRSHRTVVVEYVGHRRTGWKSSTLGSVFRWLTPGTQIESRYLIAGLPSELPWGRKEKVVRQFLTRGLANGTFTSGEEVELPVLAYRPSDHYFRKQGVAHAYTPEPVALHLAVAAEATMRTASTLASVSEIVRLISESAIRAERTKGKGMIRAGASLGALPDLIAELADGRRVGTEVISTDYHNQRVAEKFAGMGLTVDFVGTSRTVARRFARINDAACAHF